MKYLIVCHLSGLVVEYHKKLVREIAENFGVILPIKQKFKPHFTLKYNFEATDIKEVETIIGKFCSTHKKTPVRAGGFNSFRKNAIFIEVKLSAEASRVFLELIDKLKKISWMSWEAYDGPDLKFHATIAADCHKNYTEILDFIKGQEKKFDCWFDNITILKASAVIDGVTTFETHKSFRIN